jgi:DNA-binding CsgD family transcriptional regulator
MTRAEKRAEVFALFRENPDLSRRKIAKLAGISHAAVANMRKAFDAEKLTPDMSEIDTTEVDMHETEIDNPLVGKLTADKGLPTVNFSEVDIPSEPSLLDAITACIPRADWREMGLSLARGETLQAEIDAKIDARIAELTAAEREEFGLALIKEYRKPLPKQKRPWSPVLQQSKHPRQRIVELRRQGLQYQDIAALLDIPPSSARAIIQSDARELLRRHPVKTTGEERAEVIRLHKSGLSYAEIAERTGRNVATVRSIVKRERG